MPRDAVSMLSIETLLEFWPSARSAVVGAVWGLFLFGSVGWLAGWLAQRGWRVGDTRKVFHFSIFTGAALLRWQVDVGAVSVFGCVIVAGIVSIVRLGSRSPLFRALARPSDAPHEKLHVLSPLISTAIGGVLAQFIAGPQAVVAYLVAGWGDAVGEPVGIRWGRHRYRVPSLGQLKAERSWEGSAAVFVASSLAAGIGLWLSGQTGSQVVASALMIGAAATLIEAISPHGWDNLSLLIVVAWLTRFC